MVTNDHRDCQLLVIIIIHGTICKVLLRNQIWIDMLGKFGVQRPILLQSTALKFKAELLYLKFKG